MHDLESRLKQILKDRLRLDPARVEAMTADTGLLGKGIGLDSVESLSLATAMEEEFRIVIEDDELTAALFATLGTVIDFVRRKTAAPPGAPPG
jgi:acyl carrier protein